MASPLPPPTLTFRAPSRLMVRVGPVVMLATAILSALPAAAATASPRATGEIFIRQVPEPTPALLGIFGLCLILFRRDRS